MSAAPKCGNCQDSGSNPGSDYLDCVKCDSASEQANEERMKMQHYEEPDEVVDEEGPFFDDLYYDFYHKVDAERRAQWIADGGDAADYRTDDQAISAIVCKQMDY